MNINGKMKKFLGVFLSIFIIIITNIILTEFNNNIDENKTNSVEKNNDIENSNIENETIKKEYNNMPNDTGLTVDGVHKTFNQDIITKANIAYLLGCDNITENTDFDGYINQHLPKNGIYISKIVGYKEDPNNSYDFVMKSSDFMKKMCKDLNLNYEVDKNNYLKRNKKNDEICKNINKLITGNKKIIIGFLPEYYVYINDIENGLGYGDYSSSDYVSLKPYNNIYTFIYDFNSSNVDNFYEMLKEISEIDS